MTISVMTSCLFLTWALLVSVGVSLQLIPWRRHRVRRSMLENVDVSNNTAVHVHFMNLALLQAQQAERKGEVPIGAVVVQRDESGRFTVLSEAHNLIETQYDASSHAELLALRQAAKTIKNWRLLNTTLYTTLEPCPMCLSAAQAFRVSSIVYGAPDLRLGAIHTHIRLLDIRHPIHTIDEVTPGILGDESASLMRSFFRQRRQKGTPPLQRSVHLERMRRLLRVKSRA